MTVEVESPVPEKIPERRVIVYKACIDSTVVKLAVEKIKKDLFGKMGFLRPKLGDIQYVSIERYYEPYIFLDGKYSIDYYRKDPFVIEVEEDAEEINILGRKFKPEVVNDSEKGVYGVIKLEAEKLFSLENKANFILDKAGYEVSIEQMSFAPSEEDPKKVLDEFKDRVEELQIAPDEEIEILRSKIVQRPTELGRIITELFEVSERAVIYTPIYGITFHNAKTGEKKVVKLDGVTARIRTNSFSEPAPVLATLTHSPDHV